MQPTVGSSVQRCATAGVFVALIRCCAVSPRRLSFTVMRGRAAVLESSFLIRRLALSTSLVTTMDTATPQYRSEVLKELERIPAEFLPAFLKLVRAFREGVTLPTAEESFRQGWQETLSGQTHPISDLWEDIDAK